MTDNDDKVKPMSTRELEAWTKHFENLFESEPELFTTEDIIYYLGDSHPLVLKNTKADLIVKQSHEFGYDSSSSLDSADAEEELRFISPFQPEETCLPETSNDLV